MGSILIKNAKAIVTVDDHDTVLYNHNIFIKDYYISYIGKEEITADEVIDARNMIVYPGLINTHHHLYQTFTRNLPEVQQLELFPWLKTLYEIWRGLTPEMIYFSSLVGLGELLKYGCTTAFDHHYIFPKDNPQKFIDMQFAAAKKLGVRMHAARGSMSRGKSTGGLPPDDLVETIGNILTDSQRLIEKYHDDSVYSMSQVVLAPCSPFSVTSELLLISSELARSNKVHLHTHLAETKDEEQYCLEKFGVRPLAYMENLGWLGNDVWFAHGIHFTEDELIKLAVTRTGIAHCPVSNQKLSSGYAKITEMLALGINIGLGVDGSASNDCSNLLAELRVGYLQQRAHYSNAEPNGYEFLKMATKGGASLLGRSDLGSIEVRKAADLFLIDINRFEYVGAELDPKALLATMGILRPVDYTIVNGEIVVRDGKLCTIDEEKIVPKAKKLVTKLLNKHA